MKINLRQATKPTEQPDTMSKRKPTLALKAFGLFAAMAIASTQTGCAGQPLVALDSVGPVPALAAASASGSGELLVYSSHVGVADLDAEISGEPSDEWEYSGYKILTADGKRFKSVLNNAGTVQLHPQKVELPAGRYVVLAKAENGLRVTVPVVVVSRQITVLHLDDNAFPPGESGFNQTNAVHLPDGQIVGWRSAPKSLPAS